VSSQPIADYALLSDRHSAALVTRDGSIDWLCFPRFDSPSVFAALLDSDKGGRFQVAPTTEHYRSTQRYWPDSNVLVTAFFPAPGWPRSPTTWRSVRGPNGIGGAWSARCEASAAP